MSFQIISPIRTTIYGDSFNEAIKNFAKLNSDLSLTNLILQNENEKEIYYKANIRYYKENDKRKIGISVYQTYPDAYPKPLMKENSDDGSMREIGYPAPIIPVISPIVSNVEPIITANGISATQYGPSISVPVIATNSILNNLYLPTAINYHP